MRPHRRFRQILQRLRGGAVDISHLQRQIDELKILTANNIVSRIKEHGIYDDLHDTEFKVFSQFGDDGIIQYLINNISIEPQQHTFIEFGVENYIESNTRFLLIHDNWRGLVIDGSPANIEYILNDEISWKHDLTSVSHFLDRDNINAIISANQFSGDIGLLSIDVDGNDYWIWQAIDVVSPVIVVVEYNSLFGNKHAITIPYAAEFTRTRSHYSNLFWGCSLVALDLLAKHKGYQFVGSNSAGNNAYFVRQDKIGRVKPVSVSTGYVYSRFRESRDAEGRLTHIGGDKRLRLIENMQVYDIAHDRLVTIGDLNLAESDHSEHRDD